MRIRCPPAVQHRSSVDRERIVEQTAEKRWRDGSQQITSRSRKAQDDLQISAKSKSIRASIVQCVMLAPMRGNVFRKAFRIDLQEHILVLPPAWQRPTEQVGDKPPIAV